MVAAMQQIAEWLKKLGMSEYAQRFVDNDIDTSVLRDLTDQDFKDLGVSLGHRRKMLRAIAELAGAVPVPPEPAAEIEPKPGDGAERRQLTVMFCDLVGSTALSDSLDPEDLRGIIGAYHRCCTEVIEQNGGFVAKYMGDGVLSYFGYPQAHEHDAERAVRAGLALVEAVPMLATAAGMPLQVRVGIATGLVVVGDLIGSAEAQERGIVGETPNFAARLQGIRSAWVTKLQIRSLSRIAVRRKPGTKLCEASVGFDNRGRPGSFSVDEEERKEPENCDLGRELDVDQSNAA
jgi:class 3 adenylate cyclase